MMKLSDKQQIKLLNLILCIDDQSLKDRIFAILKEAKYD